MRISLLLISLLVVFSRIATTWRQPVRQNGWVSYRLRSGKKSSLTRQNQFRFFFFCSQKCTAARHFLGRPESQKWTSRTVLWTFLNEPTCRRHRLPFPVPTVSPILISRKRWADQSREWWCAKAVRIVAAPKHPSGGRIALVCSLPEVLVVMIWETVAIIGKSF